MGWIMRNQAVSNVLKAEAAPSAILTITMPMIKTVIIPSLTP